MKIFSRVDAPIIAGGINVMRSYVGKNRDTLMRFSKAIWMRFTSSSRQKEETMRIFGDYLNTRDKDVLGRFYEEISGRAEKELRPDPRSVRFVLDFIGRRYPEAKSIGENKFTDLSLIEDIQRFAAPW